MSSPVLLSWIAVNNDPYERVRNSREFFVRKDGSRVQGPTLALLTDPASPYAGLITDAVFFRQAGPEAADHTRTYEQLVEALGEHAPTLRLHPETWDGSDPTDHEAIFEFLRVALPRIRRKFRDREILIHISPGTPSMQTVWVLMAETGFIEPPVTVVKSYRPEERRGRPAVVPVSLGIDTFYKRYVEALPARVSTDEEAVGWDPARFRSPLLHQLYRDARRIARLKVPVLILGDRGTGKTTLARWIRTWSPWSGAGRPWKTVPCGQFTPETMRAELFGYRKGAFTDAKTDRDGLLKDLDGDTLFLDEVGDISRDMQRLLIKALEEKAFQPLGATELVKSDFRLVTATNLLVPVLAERLDPDFLDRISPFVLRVPALHEIREDLDWLWDNVLNEATRRAAVPAPWARMSEDLRRQVVRALQAHRLPGNLRDLFRVAWRYLAARGDSDAPLVPSDAIEWALAGLDAGGIAGDGPRVFAQAFADGKVLPEGLYAPFHPDVAFDAQRAWYADEIVRVAKIRGVPVESLSPVSDRNLRNWRRKHPAEESEK